MDPQNIHVLRQRKHDLTAEASAIFATAQGRAMTAAEKKRDDAIEAELIKLNEQIAERERQMAAEANGAGIALTPTIVRAGAAAANALPLIEGRSDRSFAAMFGKPTGTSAFESLENYLSTVHSGLHHPGLMAATSTTGVPSDGGFLVPTEHTAQLLDASLEREIVRPRCQVVPMAAETRKIAGWDSLDHSGGNLYGGFAGGWIGEAEDIPPQKGKVRQIELAARKLAILSQTSNELLQSGMSFEAMLGQAIISAISWHLDWAALRGSGANQPLGMLNDPALITVAKETSQAAGTILYANICKMFARLHPACVANAIWVASSTTIPQLLNMSIPIGDGGTYVPALKESNGTFTLLGRPVEFTEKVPSLGEKGDISLADFSQYSMGLRQEMSLAKSMHAGFQSDTTWFRAILRGDGQGRWSKPFQPANGDTQSWCVTLEART